MIIVAPTPGVCAGYREVPLNHNPNDVFRNKSITYEPEVFILFFLSN